MENEPTVYDMIGGEPAVRKLVQAFYRHMDTLPETKGIRDMHQPDLAEAIEKLSLFLMGWMGGPQLYIEKHGHPMLRKRHLPFPIGKSERDQWMNCMLLAIEEIGVEDPLKTELLGAFMRVADHMRNKPEDF